MVHALKRIHNLLLPDGIAVDIHPVPEEPQIDVRIGRASHLVGWMSQEHGCTKYAQANDAWQAVIEQGLFARERYTTFEFKTVTRSMQELEAFLQETWQAAFIEEQVVRRADDLMASATTDKEILLREIVEVSRCRRLTQGDE